MAPRSLALPCRTLYQLGLVALAEFQWKPWTMMAELAWACWVAAAACPAGASHASTSAAQDDSMERFISCLV
ncbi:hypothetical protein ACN28I_13770 [Archangium gephyra]|uniref:hypothetical protein n=1 Tax=Archangium gephyra TaxID=48 RepID=UPI003B7CDD0F